MAGHFFQAGNLTATEATSDHDSLVVEFRVAGTGVAARLDRDQVRDLVVHLASWHSRSLLDDLWRQHSRMGGD